MERRLVLVRHAKAEQGGGDDAARALSGRGRRDAGEIGRWLRAQDVVPELAVVSPAQRTVETWSIAAAELDNPPRVATDGRIYDNSVAALLAVIADSDADARSLVLVGHNPSMQDLAARLAPDDADLAASFPTSSVAMFAVSGDWGELADSDASLVAFHVCRG